MAKTSGRRPIAFTVGPPRGSRAGAVQSVIFPRPVWSLADARAWLKRHRLKASSVATLRGSYRATQRPAGDFTRLRTIETSGHPHPVKNPKRHARPFLSDYTIAELTRDPREQGFLDVQAGKPSSPPGWYTPAERGQYAEGYIAGGQGRKGRPSPLSRLKNPTPRQAEREQRDYIRHVYAQYLERTPSESDADRREAVALHLRDSRLVKPLSRARALVDAALPRPRQNPRAVRATPLEQRQAVQLFRRFHGLEPKRIGQARVVMPRMLVQVGPVPFMHYIAPWKGRETLFEHKFAKHARPMLCATHDGRALYLVGGEYDFTRDGIVDRPR